MCKGYSGYRHAENLRTIIGQLGLCFPLEGFDIVRDVESENNSKHVEPDALTLLSNTRYIL